ncbi:MAG TPA: OB-fold domain-containing protein [Candidatus Binatia bacterium]|nr:OB-fold domain-containing protein [Candidatus Binatia bacterium]
MSDGVPYEDGYFVVPDDPSEPPRLLGTRCRACGEPFYPRRATCARCLSDDVEDVLLGPRGTLYTWTFLHVPGFGEHRTAQQGHAAGQIDLDEGPRVQSVLLGGPTDFRIGMRMEMVLEPVGEDKEGRAILMYRFRPAA